MEDAAVREVREETGLLAEIEASLGETRYFYVWEDVRIRKTVHFFLMRHTGGDIDDRDDEMEEIRWFPARARAQARRLPRRAGRAGPGGRAAPMSSRMTLPEIAIAVAIGLGAGVLSGLFGVGGGIVMTPGVQVLLGAPPIVALATPLPVILPHGARGRPDLSAAGGARREGRRRG